MRAVTWHGKRDVRVDNVDDPTIVEPTDAIVRITSTAICGSDLHLYEVLGPYMRAGDILGHEPMGVVEAVGPEVTNLSIGDRVVVPFNIACGHCWMCRRQLFAHCETTQVRSHQKGAALFGYTALYGAVPGGQAEYLRVPQAQFGPIRVPAGPPDDRFLYLSDVLPTAWQAVAYADVPVDGTLAVLGLGPVGQMACRVARHQGVQRVIGVDLVPERLAMAKEWEIETVDASALGHDLAAMLIEMTRGRGPDSVIDAVGMEAHGAPVAKAAQAAVGLMPDVAARWVTDRFAVDRLTALHAALRAVRRGGTVSVVGVYGGEVDPMPMMEMFDRGVHIRMGQAHVRRWADEILRLLIRDEDPLGVDSFASHHTRLEEAPAAYKAFQNKTEGTFKVVMHP